MTNEFSDSQIQLLTQDAERAYFDAYYNEVEELAYDTHFDSYSTFDENDYEYQQGRALAY
jgi:hypothetical protein